ncbi:MAG: hypothetical protein COB12_09780 [Flavobacterium sp.]|nr:MAG: hypothetical protein COB12_09780 [Flavobacterium sp.]
MIKGNSHKREKALRIIYQINKEKVCSYIRSNSGREEEAKDVFQETIIAFYENVLNDKFKGDSTISTYLYSIARFKWLNQIKKNNIRMLHDTETVNTENFYKSPLATIIDDEKKAHIIEVFGSVGNQCKRLLIDSIYHNKSMKEIVEQGDYSSEQIARNKKYKCLKKLKELIAEKPQLIQILKSYETSM